MPEYLSPGVYVEEVSFRAKSIEGVPTSTTGMVGLAHFGPTYYAGGSLSVEPRLVTSFTEYERIYGGLEPLQLADEPDRECYLAHAVRAFFDNGGKRVYVSRVFSPRADNQPGVAFRTVSVPGTAFTFDWKARWPGALGNVQVQAVVRRSKNLLIDSSTFYPKDDPRNGWGIQATRVRSGAVVEIAAGGTPVPIGNAPLDIDKLAVVTVDQDGRQTFVRTNNQGGPQAGDTIALVELQVQVQVGTERLDVYNDLATDVGQKRFIGRILDRDDPEDENAAVWLSLPADLDAALRAAQPGMLPARLAVALQGNSSPRLEHGDDGHMPPVDGERASFEGQEADLDHAEIKATGICALDEIDDIAIVAMPDGASLSDPDQRFLAMQRLIQHCEAMRYRIAVVDGPVNASMNEIRHYRGQFDSTYAALYHPWIEILDPSQRPAQGAPQRRILLPPSGFVAGIYARSDIERGVHKAPANEVVQGLTRFEININKGRQDVLNPEGINALRFFEGRGNRVWGARTMTSDPEWKYVNVRRLFIYVEHSIDKGSQYAVFEPNGPRLWANVRRSIEDFLLVLWRDGALLGDKPEEAYFVRCDRTTMTQNDLDNGRMICLIGIAPVKPAEFVIFRIGQWTADSKV